MILWRHRVAACLILLSGLFLVPMAMHGPQDREDQYTTVLSALIHWQHIWQGRYLFWYDGLGLGTPLPLGHDFDLHPLWALWPWLPLATLMLVFWFAHLAIGSVYVWRVARALAIQPHVAATCALTFLLSAPTLNYVYSDDWSSVFFEWAMYPVLVFYCLQLTRDRPYVSRLFSACVLGVLVGFCVVTGHLGYAVVLFSVLAVFAIVLIAHRFVIIPAFAIAGLLALALSAESLFYAASEAARFPADAGRSIQDGIELSQYLRAAIRPLGPAVWDAAVRGIPWALWEAYLAGNAHTREPFFGGVFLAAAALTCLAAVPLRASPRGVEFDLRTAAWRASAACFALSVVASILPARVMPSAFSGAWLFRDTAIFFGILLAGFGLTGLARLGQRSAPVVVSLLLGVQVLQMLLVAPAAMILGFTRPAPPSYWQIGQGAGVAGWLADEASGVGRRLYIGLEADQLLQERPGVDGVYLPAELTLVGVSVVNGRFKGVSMDPLYPSPRQMNGVIASHADPPRNATLLNVLGITHVLLGQNEYGDGSRHANLTPASRRAADVTPTSRPAPAPVNLGTCNPADLEGRIVRQRDGDREYYVEAGRRREVPGADTLTALGLAGAPRAVASKECLQALPRGEVLAIAPRAVVGHAGLVLLSNPTAWPRATMLGPEATNVVLPARPGCESRGLLCKDATSLASLRLPEAVAVEIDHGRYDVKFEARDAARVLLISTLFRPEWRAWSGGAELRTIAVDGALLGVEVPRGVSGMTVEFDPVIRRSLLLLALLAVAAAASYAGFAWRASCRRPPLGVAA